MVKCVKHYHSSDAFMNVRAELLYHLGSRKLEKEKDRAWIKLPY